MNDDYDYDVSCPQCGVDATAWSVDSDVKEVYDMEPLWEGGPLVEVDIYPARLEATNHRVTLQPCGHTLPTEGLTVTRRKRDR